MKNQTKPDYWNSRTKANGKTAVARLGYSEEKMNEVTGLWWGQLKDYFIDVSSVIEVGAGWGRWGQKIGSTETHYVGVDVSEELVGLSHNAVQLIQPGKFPFEDSVFDMVFCITVLQHITDNDCMSTIEEMDRVSKDGAAFLIVENTTDMACFRTVEEYQGMFSDYVELTEDGEITEGKETMSILYGEKT